MKLAGGLVLAVTLTAATLGTLVFVDASAQVNLPYAIVTAAAGLLCLASITVLVARRPARAVARPAAERVWSADVRTPEVSDAVRPVEVVVIWLITPRSADEERAA
jgi:hypothetical protein